MRYLGGRDFHSVHLEDKTTDIARAHALSVHRQYVVFQLASDDQLPLWDDLGRERPLAVAAAFNLQMARIDAPDGLFCLTIAAVAHAGDLVLGQVVVQLAFQH